jgi:hypothetical protein
MLQSPHVSNISAALLGSKQALFLSRLFGRPYYSPRLVFERVAGRIRAEAAMSSDYTGLATRALRLHSVTGLQQSCCCSGGCLIFLLFRVEGRLSIIGTRLLLFLERSVRRLTRLEHVFAVALSPTDYSGCI